jgi:sterol 3beta-glucosyltransferase
MFDQVFWRATSGQVNRWRKELLKLRPTNLDAMAQHKIPFLYNFSPVVIPPPLDWRENIHVTGYWWLDNPDDSKSKKWEPPQELLDFLEEAKTKDKKVVFIGFGSIIIPDPLEMTRVVAEAVEKAGVYAIVARGWSDRASNKGDSEEDKKQQEDNEKQQASTMDKPFIHNVKSVPHDWLFPRISAAVHHGGAGTTGASLRGALSPPSCTSRFLN